MAPISVTRSISFRCPPVERSSPNYQDGLAPFFQADIGSLDHEGGIEKSRKPEVESPRFVYVALIFKLRAQGNQTVVFRDGFCPFHVFIPVFFLAVSTIIFVSVSHPSPIFPMASGVRLSQ